MNSSELPSFVLRTAEAVACLCGFITWRKWRGTPWRWFTIYLLFIVAAEACGQYTGHHRMKEASEILFNIIVKPAQYFFAFLLFYWHAERNGKRLVLLLSGAYALVFAWDLVVHKYDYFTVSPTLGSALLLVLILRFLLDLAAGDDILYFKTSMFFWVVTGYLVYYLGSLPFRGLYNYLVEHHLGFFYAYRQLALLLSATMYVLFSIGFLWARKLPHS